MHPTISYYNLLPGDRIVEPKNLLRLAHHHAIYAGSDNNGQDWIVENQFGTGVRLITAQQYFNTVFEITRIERFPGNNYQRKVSIQKALAIMGRSYDLINFNCEHFANYVQHDSVHSSQVNTVAKVAVGASAVALGIGLLSLIFDDES